MKSSNWLAKALEWSREVIESAETPASKLAIFILPMLSPLVPAFMTGLHVYKIMHVMFEFSASADWIAVTMAVVVGVTLELLGYVGVVAFIQDLHTWIKNRVSEQLVSVFLSGLSYVFYLAAMWLINYSLGVYFGTPDIINRVVGLLSFITAPTGLLAAKHLTQKAEQEQNDKLRQEAREDKLKHKALKHGINPWGGGSELVKSTRGPKQKYASDYKEQIPVMLQEYYEKNGKVMELTEITAKLKLDHNTNKGFVSTQRSAWMAKNSIPNPKKPMGF